MNTDKPDFRSKAAAAFGRNPPNVRTSQPSPTLPQMPGGNATFCLLLSFTTVAVRSRTFSISSTGGHWLFSSDRTGPQYF